MPVPNPDFPPQRYVSRCEPGFETDRRLIEPSTRVWDFLFAAVKNFICCNPLLKSYEVDGWDGVRFMLTEEAEFMDCPPLIVYFKVDEEARRIAFLSVQLESDYPGFWVDPEDMPPGLM